jgi:hypothetical protein
MADVNSIEATATTIRHQCARTIAPSKPLGRDDLVLHGRILVCRVTQAYSTGSSAMPQRRILICWVGRGAPRVMGCATTLQTLVKGLPLPTTKTYRKTREPVRRSRRGNRHATTRDGMDGDRRIQ